MDYRATSATFGNFAFILSPSNVNAFSLDRRVRIEVDRPLTVQLAISAAFSGPTLPNFLGFARLGGGPDFKTGLTHQNISALIGQEGMTSVPLFRNYGNISLGVSGRGTEDGVIYDILLSPLAEGLSETLELRWSGDYESRLSKAGANQLTVDLDEAGTITETLTITAIPEPSCWLATTVGLGFLARRRRQVA